MYKTYDSSGYDGPMMVLSFCSEDTDRGSLLQQVLELWKVPLLQEHLLMETPVTNITKRIIIMLTPA